MKLKIKIGDKVKVISGSEKGKIGNVLEIKKKPLKIKVQGVLLQTHFDAKKGILKKEAFFDYSNVKFMDERVTKNT